MRKKLLAVVVVATLALTALVAFASPASAYQELRANLTGEQEAPHNGDPDGRGFARFFVHPFYGYVCWRLTVERIQLPAPAAHIHEAPRGEPGPIVITIAGVGKSGKSQGCVTAERALLRDIAKRPWRYYVNVHNSPFPAGAIRGQLHYPR